MNWSKSYYAPTSGAWHEIVNCLKDARMNFCQIINVSPTMSARVVVAICAASDLPILPPHGVSLAETGAIGGKVYEYIVTAVKADGRETGGVATVGTGTGADVLNENNYHAVSWQAVTGAASYRVYCRVGGTESSLLYVAEVTGALTYVNTGGMSVAAKWPWCNMTGVSAVLAWSELAPGVGLEPISRPVSLAVGDVVRFYTTGAVSVFASGEV